MHRNQRPQDFSVGSSATRLFSPQNRRFSIVKLTSPKASTNPTCNAVTVKECAQKIPQAFARLAGTLHPLENLPTARFDLTIPADFVSCLRYSPSDFRSHTSPRSMKKSVKFEVVSNCFISPQKPGYPCLLTQSPRGKAVQPIAILIRFCDPCFALLGPRVHVASHRTQPNSTNQPPQNGENVCYRFAGI